MTGTATHNQLTETVTLKAEQIDLPAVPPEDSPGA